MKGFKPALGIVLYVVALASTVVNGSRFFPHINEAFAPLMFLTIFSFSALACVLIVFYRPYMLFIDKKGKEAGQLVLGTAKWLGVFALIIVTAVAMMSR